MSSDENDIWSRLLALRTVTSEHGVLHQAHLDQLKLWGRLAFQKYAPAEIEIAVNFVERDVTYRLTGKKLDEVKRQAMLIAGLDRSLAEMLGDEWRLIVEQDGNPIYTGRRRKTVAQRTNERRATRSARSRRRKA